MSCEPQVSRVRIWQGALAPSPLWDSSGGRFPGGAGYRWEAAAAWASHLWMLGHLDPLSGHRNISFHFWLGFCFCFCWPWLLLAICLGCESTECAWERGRDGEWNARSSLGPLCFDLYNQIYLGKHLLTAGQAMASWLSDEAPIRRDRRCYIPHTREEFWDE